MINNDVTAAICTKNAEANLELCLKNLQKLELNRIIAVDAESIDKTQQILKRYAVEIFNDFFKTLGGARSIAVKNTKTKYILFLGPDNLINKSGTFATYCKFKICPINLKDFHICYKKNIKKRFLKFLPKAGSFTKQILDISKFNFKFAENNNIKSHLKVYLKNIK